MLLLLLSMEMLLLLLMYRDDVAAVEYGDGNVETACVIVVFCARCRVYRR